MFQPKNLSVVGYANGFTIWPYISDDDPKTVLAGTYFNKAYDSLREGDMIYVFFSGRTLSRTGVVCVDAITKRDGYTDVVVSLPNAFEMALGKERV